MPQNIDARLGTKHNEMIERVARSIAANLHSDADAIAAQGMEIKAAWLFYETTARAAIEAMLVPTEAMIDAGCDAGFRASGDMCRDENREPVSWRAMIREALK